MAKDERVFDFDCILQSMRNIIEALYTSAAWFILNLSKDTVLWAAHPDQLWGKRSTQLAIVCLSLIVLTPSRSSVIIKTIKNAVVEILFISEKVLVVFTEISVKQG